MAGTAWRRAVLLWARQDDRLVYFSQIHLRNFDSARFLAARVLDAPLADRMRDHSRSPGPAAPASCLRGLNSTHMAEPVAMNTHPMAAVGVFSTRSIERLTPCLTVH